MIDLGFMVILRPWALLLLIPTLWFMWWIFNRQDETKKWTTLINKAFLPYLLIKENKKASRIAPFWFIGSVMILMVLALSGPSFGKNPSPFKDDTAKAVLVLKNTPGMQAADLQPNRLKRAVFKINDLLTLRPKLQTALIAYSGSANLALPMTHDAAIIESFASALDPSVMPVRGDALAKAVSLAVDTLKTAGTIIVFADTIKTEEIDKIAAQHTLGDSDLLFFVTISKELIDRESYDYAKKNLNAKVVYFSDDDSDIQQTSDAITHNFKQAGNNKSDRRDDGYYLIFLIVLITLFWFRKGFLAEAWRVS